MNIDRAEMRWRAAVRGGAKWTATIAAVLALGVWISSAWRHVDYVAPTGHYAGVGMGRIVAGWIDPSIGISKGFRVFEWRNKQPFFASRRFDWTFDAWSLSDQWGVQVPGWLPVMALAIGAACLWRWDRVARLRERAGLCQSCGYSRAGLPSGSPCPECGAKAQAE